MGEGKLPLAGSFLSFNQGRIAIWSPQAFAMAPASYCIARRSPHDLPSGVARPASWAKASGQLPLFPNN
jgi:hypothetical protein